MSHLIVHDHIGKRRGFEERSTTRPDKVRASGQLAYARIYDEAPRPPAKMPGWFVEYLHPNGHWLTAGREMQGRTITEAQNVVRVDRERMRLWVACGKGYAIARFK